MSETIILAGWAEIKSVTMFYGEILKISIGDTSFGKPISRILREINNKNGNTEIVFYHEKSKGVHGPISSITLGNNVNFQFEYLTEDLE